MAVDKRATEQGQKDEDDRQAMEEGGKRMREREGNQANDNE